MEEAWKAQAKAMQELDIEEHKKPSLAMEEMINKRVEELLTANTEPIEPGRYKEPFMYYEPAVATGGLPAAICTCGWKKHHVRLKVLKAAAEKHYIKTGHKPS